MEKMKKQAKRERDYLAQLPEPMIHLIQSFLTGKEAARSCCLAKSWGGAWLTRPTLSFDERDLKEGFAEFSRKSMKRYRDKNLTIERLFLHARNQSVDLVMELTADAIKLGATDLDIEVRPYYLSKFVLPAEVLGSETLTRLCLRGGYIGGGNVRCSKLKSLALQGGVAMVEREKKSQIIREIISCCSSCIDELSLCLDDGIDGPIWMLLRQLHNLRVLHLRDTKMEEWFFIELASRYPWLKDLSLDNCQGYSPVTKISSTSLECISFLEQKKALKAEFDVPNIRKFVYSGSGLPTLNFKPCSREWESDISIKWSPHSYSSSWFTSLEEKLRMLKMASSSKISLTISPYYEYRNKKWEISDFIEREIQGVENPVVVEKLTILAESSSPASYYSYLLQLGLLKFCRPNSIVNASQIDHAELFCFLDKLNDNLSNQNLNLVMEWYDEIHRDWRLYGHTTMLDESTALKTRIRCT